MSLPNFTCNSCVIQFKSSDLQRYHMKTEWHRYNLKRRVANLTPINAAQFAEKLQISERERAKHEVDEYGFAILKPIRQGGQPSKEKRRLKQKKNQSLKEHRGRLQSSIDGINKALTLEPTGSLSPARSVASEISKLSLFSEETNTDFGEDTVSEYEFTSESNYDSDSSATESLDISDRHTDLKKIIITDCIYCGAENREVERNVTHMFQAHGLYIPERSYLINLQGLLTFLNDRIVVNKLCLCCNFKGSSLESIRAHMHSKRHSKLPYETKEEREQFSEFYDFSSLLSDNNKQHNRNSNSSKSIHFAEGLQEELEDETVDDVQILDSDINSNYTVVPVDDTGMQLTLPNGARVGHRVGQRYYRQNLPSPPSTNESRRTVTAADRRLISGVTEKQFKQGLKKMQQLENNAVNRQIRQEKTKKVNYKAHFRDEMLQ